MTYLVVVDDAGAAGLTFGELAAAVAQQWAVAEPVVDLGALDRSRVLEWEARTAEGGVVEVAVNKELTCFFLDGTPEGSAEVMVWVRGLVDDAVGLTVCDDGYSFDFALDPGMSPLQVAHEL